MVLVSVRIPDEKSPLYDKVRQVAEASFPPSERRGPRAQAAVFADSRYRLDAWLDGTRLVGFMGWWDFGGFRYIEHVAVAPEARSGGYGGKIVTAWMRQGDTPVYLEIEQVVDEITRRRLGFYQRLGFIETPMTHVQPPYQGAGAGVPMQVLSWPVALTDREYERFSKLLFHEVWADIGGEEESGPA